MGQRLKKIQQSIVNNQPSRLTIIRNNCKLDGQELKQVLYKGGYKKYIQPVFDLMVSEPNIYKHHNIENQSFKEQRESAAKMTLHLLNKLKISMEDGQKIYHVGYALNSFDLGLDVKTLITYQLYCKAIQLLGNRQSHKEYIRRVERGQDIGCFGLTEFYHGSFSRGIQTLAKYDHSKKQFVLTTQQTKGMKFWIGAAAQLANTAVIWAQLIINGKSEGPHCFVLRLRDKNHNVLPGIKIGDCGHKNGLNYIDNGFIILEDVRIPKNDLLGRLGDIDDNGNYTTNVQRKELRFGLHMSALSGGRANFSYSSLSTGINAITTALRYATNRRQFDNAKKTQEVFIIDYPLTKHRIIPYMAAMLVYLPGGRFISGQMIKDYSIFSDPNSKLVSEIHAVSAVAKVKSSVAVSRTITQCRSLLGGHGFSAYSRFGSIYHDNDVNMTWEGDNNLLLQQTSKYVMKLVESKAKGKGNFLDISFIHKPLDLSQTQIIANLRNIKIVEALLGDILRKKYYQSKLGFKSISEKLKPNDQWDYMNAILLNSLSLSFGDYYYFIIFMKDLAEIKNKENITFLTKILYLWAFGVIDNEKYGSYELRKAIQQQIIKLCDELADSCISVCDFIAPHSSIIGSPFAHQSGNGWNEYLGLIYGGKDTFRRVDYYQEIVNARQKKY